MNPSGSPAPDERGPFRASAEGQRETARSASRNVRHRARARKAPTPGSTRKKSRATPATGASIHATVGSSVHVHRGNGNEAPPAAADRRERVRAQPAPFILHDTTENL